MPIFIERNHFLELHSQLDHVKYGWGAKALFQTPPEKIEQIDCSGYARYILFHATDGKIKIPGGSWNQNNWCKTQGLSKCVYKDIVDSRDNVLRIAFIRPNPKKRIQHVWLVLNGKTYESHGSRGVNSRPARTEILIKNVNDCYEIAKTYLLTLGPVTIK